MEVVNIVGLVDALLLGTICGLIGGLGKTFLIGGRFTLPRKFVDHNGDTHILYGSLTELFLGVVAAIVTVLPYYQDMAIGYAIYVSIGAGIGGSSIIGSVLDKQVEKRRKQVKEEISNYDIGS